MKSMRFTPAIAIIVVALITIATCTVSAAAQPAATFTVNNTSDQPDAHPGDGVCETGSGNGVCTLRAAIMEANALPGVDTIAIPAGTYYLTISGAFENASATGDLDITDGMTIMGDQDGGTVIDAASLGDRILQILPGVFSVVIQDITLQNGSAADNGGAIASSGILSLQDVYIYNNHADGAGGGINSSGQLSLYTCVIERNSAGEGGGIYAFTSLTVYNSLFFNNAAAMDGGGLYLLAATAQIINTQFEQNGSSNSGGAIYNYQSDLALQDSEIHYNVSGSGGGIYNEEDSILSLSNVQFSDNNGINTAGGIFNHLSDVTGSVVQFLSNTANRGGAIYTLDGDIHLSQARFSYNSVSQDGGAFINGFGSRSSLSESIVNNNTAETFGGAIRNEQELVLSSVKFFSNACNNGGGAIYNNAIGTLSMYLVEFLGNVSYTSGGAISNDMGAITGERVLFDTNFSIDGGAVWLADNTSLTLERSELIGNIADFNGGAIDTEISAVILKDTAIISNTATNGGGIYISGLASLENCTVSGNHVSFYGGGIANVGTIALENSTIANNLVGQNGSGGGIYGTAPSYTGLRNTIIYGNHLQITDTFYDNDCAATLTSQHYNLIGTMLNCTLNNQDHDLTGIDPLLAPLAYNSGPTLNHALLSNSPAIDAANPDGCFGGNSDLLTMDQRGFIRPWDGNGDGAVICDIGSYEYGSVIRFFLPLTVK